MQVLVSEPLVAVMVAVSPLLPPLTENVGVVSVVLLSVSEFPVSDDAARSGAPGALGVVVSTVRDVAELAGEVTPPDVIVPVTFHVPSVSAGSVHEVADPMVYVQDCVVAPLVAVMVAVSPLLPPLTENVGVVSVVLLSVLEFPVSDSAARSGAVGAAGPAT